MSTRATVCVMDSTRYSYMVRYKHCDGYPTGLGYELVRALRTCRTAEELFASVKLENFFVDEVREPEDCHKLQGDLEYIYAIRMLDDVNVITGLRTTNPYLSSLPYTCFPIFSLIVNRDSPDDTAVFAILNSAEHIGTGVLRLLSEFEHKLEAR